MSEKIQGTVFGMPVYASDPAPDTADLRGWFIHVLKKYDADFRFEYAVMGLEYIKSAYDLKTLTLRYGRVMGNNNPMWAAAIESMKKTP